MRSRIPATLLVLGVLAGVPTLVGLLFGEGVMSLFTEPSIPPEPQPRTPTTAAQAQSQIMIWCASLLGASVFLVIAAWIIRRKFMVHDDGPAVGTMGMGFSLSDLRQMHEDGQLTDDEFIAAKKKVLDKAKAVMTGPEDSPDTPSAPVFFDPADNDDDLLDDPDKNDHDTPPPRDP